MIFSLIEAGVMQVPEIYGIAVFVLGVFAIGGIFVYFTKGN